MVEAGHDLGGRLGRHAARRRGDQRRLRDGLLGRRLHDEPAARGRDGREGLGRLRLRRRAARPRARRAGAPPRSAPLLLEEREVGARPAPDGRGRAGVLGGARLPPLRRPVAGAAVLGRLTWLLAEVVEIVPETPRVKSLVLAVPGWAGHRPGQHVDVRLTAEDGYQAQRSYSVATPADGERVVLTVERLEDGEVSPFLTDELLVGDRIELRGPIGGYFVWDGAEGAPLHLVAGGSGVVPLMAMLRHRAGLGSAGPAALL